MDRYRPTIASGAPPYNALSHRRCTAEPDHRVMHVGVRARGRSTRQRPSSRRAIPDVRPRARAVARDRRSRAPVGSRLGRSAATGARLPGLPPRQRLERAGRPPAGPSRLGRVRREHRARRAPPPRFRLLRGIRHPLEHRDARHEAIGRVVPLAERVRSRPVPDPSQASDRGRKRPAHPDGRPGPLQTVRALRRAPRERAVARGLGSDLGPALEPAPARWLDERRCGRPADPPGPCPLAGGP